MIPLRDHFEVPEGLELYLAEHRVWAFGPEGAYLRTLWGSTIPGDHHLYMCDTVANHESRPFWDTTRMSDLIECTYGEWLQHCSPEDWAECVCCGRNDDTLLSQDPSGEWWCTECTTHCVNSYAEKINAPLTEAEITALNKALASKDHARYKRRGTNEPQ